MENYSNHSFKANKLQKAINLALLTIKSSSYEIASTETKKKSKHIKADLPIDNNKSSVKF